jgi:hypothetical protein
MKSKSILMLYGFLAVILSILFIACGKSDEDVTKNDKQTENKTATESKFVAEGKYFCPMHPTQQTDDVDAKCPVCKMKLDSKAEYNKKMMDEHSALEEKYHGKMSLIHFEVNLSVIKSDECQSIIESALSKDPGVMDYSLDILNHVIHMYIDKTKTSKSNVEKLISDAGFDANNIKANPEAMAKLPDDCK